MFSFFARISTDLTTVFGTDFFVTTTTFDTAGICVAAIGEAGLPVDTASLGAAAGTSLSSNLERGLVTTVTMVGACAGSSSCTSVLVGNVVMDESGLASLVVRVKVLEFFFIASIAVMQPNPWQRLANVATGQQESVR